MSKRIAAVTGAFGALGKVVVGHLVEQGYAVAALDLAASPASALPDGTLVLGGIDLTDEHGASGAFERVRSELGGLDVLINIAGGFAWETLADGEIETWDRMYRLNLKTALVACRTALPHLRKSQSGRIVNVGANAALRSGAGMGAYAASKSAVMRLTESLAEELKGSGLTVNAVLPSIIDTPANRADMPDADPSTWVAPDELAFAIGFLASQRASAVTGALLPVVGRV
ncbi:MAG: SDR family NAD(P)-dependent oxidoreductase [Gammaproteobacteria bacterium]|nr:SDR family NAD(P)-dependent oxidoreductase [Gammaproteobacteria bacterium]